ncbi:MAG: hypothetical protein PVH61_25740 [Candidatus Aminicenantes bacterium]|jgi:hypothetical protein
MAEKKPTINNKDLLKRLNVPGGIQPQLLRRTIDFKPMDRLQPIQPVDRVKPPEPVQPVDRAKPPEPVQPREEIGELPTAMGSNPFENLPYPSPGDRIKADDFKKLSQGLRVIYDIYRLSGELCGRDFGEVKLALVSHQYEIQKVMSVFGNEINNLEDESLDHRQVLQVLPVELGEPGVIVIVTEAVAVRRTVPNLLGKTYAEAREILGSSLGDAAFPSGPTATPNLVGRSLSDIKAVI